MSPRVAVSHLHVLLGWTCPVFTRFGDHTLPGRMVCSLHGMKHAPSEGDGVWRAAPGSDPADGMKSGQGDTVVFSLPPLLPPPTETMNSEHLQGSTFPSRGTEGRSWDRAAKEAIV